MTPDDLLDLRNHIRAGGAALAGFMKLGAGLELDADVLRVVPHSDSFTRYLNDNRSTISALASEFFGRPIEVEVTAPAADDSPAPQASPAANGDGKPKPTGTPEPVPPRSEPNRAERRRTDRALARNVDRKASVHAKINWALAYARHNLKVFPCHFIDRDRECSCGKLNCKSAGKHPRYSGWQTDASTDEATIRKWWEEDPDYNIGVACGEASGITVLDVDRQHQGDETLRELEHELGELPETPTVQTGGGGAHQYFQFEPELGNAVGFAPGLDIRNSGGLVIGAGSVNGVGPYRWMVGYELSDTLRPSKMPPWLIEKIKQGQGGSKSAAGGEGFKVPPKIPQGQRNAELYRAGRSAKARDVPAAGVKAELDAINQERCEPPVDAEELEQIFQSVMTAADRPDWPGGEKAHTYQRTRGNKKAAPPAADVNEVPYSADGRGLWWLRPTKEGPIATPLTNFTAEILADISRDDGVERERHIEVKATLAGRPYEFSVAAADFHSLRWVSRELGGRAIIYAGNGRTDHARCAIQMLSGNIADRTVHTATGWRLVGDRWIYLHGGGAIGTDGAISTIETDLPFGLQHYILPDPPQGEDLKTAVRASLGLVDRLAPDPIVFSLLATVYCPLVCDANFTTFMVGPTGTFKTEMAALSQQHYGAEMVADKLPTSFKSTANANELLAFAAKDALLVVDEFKPTGSHADRERMQREAEHFIRAQGNRQGRGRLRSDITHRWAKPPRGGALGTGEELPRGLSLRARMWIVEVAPGDIAQARLTECQRAAAAGLYAQAAAGFIKWLAPRYAEVVQGFKAKLSEARGELAASEGHWRGKDIQIKLSATLAVVLDFAAEMGAIDAREQSDLIERGENAFQNLAECQVAAQQADNPALRFVSLIASAIGSGAAHVAGTDGQEPDNPVAWGWRLKVIGAGEYARGEWQPQGDRIGWLDGEDLYLDPDASFRAASRMASGANDLDVGVQSLRKRLHEAGFLKTTGYGSERRQTLMVRRLVEGRRIEVLHTRSDIFSSDPSLLENLPDKPDQESQTPF